MNDKINDCFEILVISVTRYSLTREKKDSFLGVASDKYYILLITRNKSNFESTRRGYCFMVC